MNFSKFALDNGGSIHPLIIPSELTNGTGLMNPSIFIDNGKIIVNIRHVNYTFYHSEKKLFQHQWGPLTYVHPENDMHLRTNNYYCELDENFNIIRYNKIDTSKFPDKELWEFVGLEDARIFRWNEKLYISGVRRDLDAIGTGRMELCEIEVREDSVVEVNRFRIPPPNDPNSYCEKNWMPIVDQPYHYIKWSNPTEVVRVYPESETSETISLSEYIPLPRDLRGGSQVIRIGKYYVAITHEVNLFNSEVGRKDAKYLHRVVVWDQSWNIIKYSDEFSLMGGDVEFCVGLTEYNGYYLITFGFQDNAAYLLKFSLETLEKFIGFSFYPEKKKFKPKVITCFANFNKKDSNKTNHIYQEPQFGESWFTYPNLYQRTVNEFPSGSIFVEVGCWKGKSSAFMASEIANSKKDIQFYCVDTWEGSVEHQDYSELSELYDIFLNNMKPLEPYYFPMKISSLSAANKFKDQSLDFVFLDASHKYEDVKKDILSWLPKVKSGGILAGHDYYVEGTDWFPGVKKAVNEIFGDIETSEDCWIIKV